mmetsp:Transcript_24512/g.72893  ORF Transcript_24512/g.72893 Transcript_24512/m.72893 type:complete len:465 (-) Transcript_24512:13-1407(-)
MASDQRRPRGVARIELARARTGVKTTCVHHGTALAPSVGAPRPRGSPETGSVQDRLCRRRRRVSLSRARGGGGALAPHAEVSCKVASKLVQAGLAEAREGASPSPAPSRLSPRASPDASASGSGPVGGVRGSRHPPVGQGPQRLHLLVRLLHELLCGELGADFLLRHLAAHQLQRAPRLELHGATGLPELLALTLERLHVLVLPGDLLGYSVLPLLHQARGLALVHLDPLLALKLQGRPMLWEPLFMELVLLLLHVLEELHAPDVPPSGGLPLRPLSVLRLLLLLHVLLVALQAELLEASSLLLLPIPLVLQVPLHQPLLPLHDRHPPHLAAQGSADPPPLAAGRPCELLPLRVDAPRAVAACLAAVAHGTCGHLAAPAPRAQPALLDAAGAGRASDAGAGRAAHTGSVLGGVGELDRPPQPARGAGPLRGRGAPLGHVLQRLEPRLQGTGAPRLGSVGEAAGG